MRKVSLVSLTVWKEQCEFFAWQFITGTKIFLPLLCALWILESLTGNFAWLILASFVAALFYGALIAKFLISVIFAVISIFFESIVGLILEIKYRF